MTEYLASLGHKRIAFINQRVGIPDSHVGERRIDRQRTLVAGDSLGIAVLLLLVKPSNTHNHWVVGCLQYCTSDLGRHLLNDTEMVLARILGQQQSGEGELRDGRRVIWFSQQNLVQFGDSQLKTFDAPLTNQTLCEQE